MKISVTGIYIWNKKVGIVVWDEKRNIGHFQYEDNFDLELSPIKLPAVKNKIYSFPELRDKDTFKGMPGLLADSLPDKYANTLINTWLASQNRPSNSLNPVEMLSFIGNRGMGALEFRPEKPKQANVSYGVDIDHMVEIANQILDTKVRFTSRLNSKKEKDILDILKIGSSAGGARAKAIIAYNPTTHEVRSGQTDAPSGFSHWIIKFDGVKDEKGKVSNGYGRVEYAYYLMALDSGIIMSECKLFEDDYGRAHFMTKRFDRMGNKKIHMQTFCALRHFDYHEIKVYSYEQIFETMRALNLPYPQIEQLYRRMVFNIMARNQDDHAKNFSFLMNQNGEWSFSPAYDMTFSYKIDSIWVAEHSLLINGKTKNFNRYDLLIVANRMGIKKPETIIEEIQRAIDLWPAYAQQAKVSSTKIKAIQEELIRF